MRREIRDQVRLSFLRSLEFCVSSIRHRFFRSAVTLAVIVLAVAFLMNILTETIITSSVARGVEREFADIYAADVFEQRVTRHKTLAPLIAELARLRPGGARWNEIQGWSGLGNGEFAQLAGTSKQEIAYREFFDKLDYGRRRTLVKNRAEGAAVFEQLSGDAALAEFAAALRTPEMASLWIPGEVDGLIAFLKGWKAFRERVAALNTAMHAALEKLDAKLNRPLKQALDQASSFADAARQRKAADELHQALTAAGFAITAEELAIVCRCHHNKIALAKLRDYLQDFEFKNKWPELQFGGEFTPEILLRRYRGDERVHKWVMQRAETITTRLVAPLPCTTDELVALAEMYRQRVETAGRAEVASAATGKEFGSTSARQREFLAYLQQSEHLPVFTREWEKLGLDEPFSRDSLLWHFNSSEPVRRWLFDTCKLLSKPMPCTRDDVQALVHFYRRAVERRGLAEIPLEKIGAEQPLALKLAAYLQAPLFKAGWDALGINLDYSPGAAVLYCAGDDGSARVLAYVQRIAKRIAARTNAPLPVEEAELATLAEAEATRLRLDAMRQQFAAKGTTADGIDERTFWLIVVSFLVCVVGIANAMLMAVTERFREIATMKCIGALDQFIMTIFLIESCLQGLIGAVFGVVLGLLLAVLRCGGAFGLYTASYFPWVDVASNTLISTGAGMLLAMLAAVYPAWVASRMAPMEAMRVE